jgi:hypothetical protein
MGGLASTFVPPGTDVPWPRPLAFLDGHRLSLFAHLLRNVLFGALAGFVLWALAAPNSTFSTFSSDDVRVGQVAAAVIIGGGGVSALNRLFQQAGRIEANERQLAAAREIANVEIGELDE